MMKRNILSMICIFMGLCSHAEIEKPLALKEFQEHIKNHDVKPRDLIFRITNDSVSIGLSLGSQGIGVATHLSFDSRWKLRLDATILPFKASHDYMAFQSRPVGANLNANILKAQVLADWQPFHLSSNFLQKLAFSGGLSYFFSAKGSVSMKLKDPYYYGDIEVSGDEVGELLITSNWNGFAPYAGFGLNRFRLINSLSIDITAGAFYLSSPSVQISGTKMLSENTQNQIQLQKNLNKYRLMPSLQLRFNYPLKY